jgi:hypothetical protein
MSRGYQGDMPAPEPSSYEIGEEIALIVMGVDKVDVVVDDDVSNCAYDPEIELPVFWNFVVGQAASTRLVRNAKLLVSDVSNIRYDYRHTGSVVVLSG